VSLDFWIFGVFLCVVYCSLFMLGNVWCVLALWKARMVELMKVFWSSSWFSEMAGFAKDISE